MISIERQAFLAKEIVNGLNNSLDLQDKDRALRITKIAMEDFVNGLSNIDQIVRKKITSIKRGVLEGTNEWKALYDRFYSEEMRKR